MLAQVPSLYGARVGDLDGSVEGSGTAGEGALTMLEMSSSSACIVKLDGLANIAGRWRDVDGGRCWDDARHSGGGVSPSR